MAEEYTGKLHLLKAGARERWEDTGATLPTRWGELKETGVGESVKSNVKVALLLTLSSMATRLPDSLLQVLKSKLIRSVNCGEDYSHHYRRKTRLELTRVTSD